MKILISTFLLLLFMILTTVKVKADTQNSQIKTYHVEVNTKHGLKIFAVNAPSDSYALDSVNIGVTYNKRFPLPISARVVETGLSTADLPQSSFEVVTEEKHYMLYLNVANPSYALTAIQASKYLMSKTVAREVYSKNDNAKLKSRSVTKYIVQFVGQDITILLNTENIEEGRLALDIAAKISNRASDYIGVKIPNYTCGKMFAH